MPQDETPVKGSAAICRHCFKPIELFPFQGLPALEWKHSATSFWGCYIDQVADKLAEPLDELSTLVYAQALREPSP